MVSAVKIKCPTLQKYSTYLMISSCYLIQFENPENSPLVRVPVILKDSGCKINVELDPFDRN